MYKFVVMYYTGISSKPFRSYSTLKEAKQAAQDFRNDLFQGGIEEFEVWVEFK